MGADPGRPGSPAAAVRTLGPAPVAAANYTPPPPPAPLANAAPSHSDASMGYTAQQAAANAQTAASQVASASPGMLRLAQNLAGTIFSPLSPKPLSAAPQGSQLTGLAHMPAVDAWYLLGRMASGLTDLTRQTGSDPLTLLWASSGGWDRQLINNLAWQAQKGFPNDTPPQGGFQSPPNGPDRVPYAYRGSVPLARPAPVGPQAYQFWHGLIPSWGQFKSTARPFPPDPSVAQDPGRV